MFKPVYAEDGFIVARSEPTRQVRKRERERERERERVQECGNIHVCAECTLGGTSCVSTKFVCKLVVMSTLAHFYRYQDLVVLLFAPRESSLPHQTPLDVWVEQWVWSTPPNQKCRWKLLGQH